MQSVSSRIWTCVAVYISDEDNHYTMGTSISIMEASPLDSLVSYPGHSGKSYPSAEMHSTAPVN